MPVHVAHIGQGLSNISTHAVPALKLLKIRKLSSASVPSFNKKLLCISMYTSANIYVCICSRFFIYCNQFLLAFKRIILLFNPDENLTQYTQTQLLCLSSLFCLYIHGVLFRGTEFPGRISVKSVFITLTNIGNLSHASNP